MASNNPSTITIYGRLSFPVFTMAEAVARNATSPNPKKDEQVTPEFNLLLEQAQFDKYVKFVKDVFLPYCQKQSEQGEKRNALTEAEVKRILKTVDSDWTEQPPYISLKPVSEKSLALMPNAVAMLKIVGQRGQDMNLQAIVNDESELAVPDPDLITFPIIKPINQTVHQMYPGAYVAATLNLYSFISGKVPGFSSSASTAIFKADADRFGGGVDVDMEDIFMD